MSKSSKPVHPHELIEKRHQLKMKIVIWWPIFLLSIYPLVTLTPVLKMKVLGSDAKHLAQLEQQIETFQLETVKQRKQIDAQKQLIEHLKQKNGSVTLETDVKQLKLPVIGTRFISWQVFQQQHPKASFADYRDARDKFRSEQLERALAFINSLRTN